MKLPKFAEYFWKMYDSFQKADNKYSFPFPMAVFGTLRNGHCNNALMGCHKGSKPIVQGWRCSDAKYSCRSKSFVPHMLPCGLWLEYSENCSGVAEVFIYSKDNWNKMIRNVDSLEGFYPGSNHGGYNRTLVKAKLLPKTYASVFFEKTTDRHSGLTTSRNLGIDPETWDEYLDIPVWIYANNDVNRSVSKLASSSILWYN